MFDFPDRFRRHRNVLYRNTHAQTLGKFQLPSIVTIVTVPNICAKVGDETVISKRANPKIQKLFLFIPIHFGLPKDRK